MTKVKYEEACHKRYQRAEASSIKARCHELTKTRIGLLRTYGINCGIVTNRQRNARGTCKYEEIATRESETTPVDTQPA
eukprot:5923710-Heterocapsa_arctica.AAC.1